MMNYRPLVIKFEASLASTNNATENIASSDVSAYDEYKDEVRKSDAIILAKYSK